MASTLRFTRQNFIDYVFQPYNAAVKRGEYEKIDYKIWKEIRSWAYDNEFDGWYIKLFSGPYSWDIYPYRDSCITPQVHTIMVSNHSFASWLTDHYAEILMWDEGLRDALNSTSIQSTSPQATSTYYTIKSDNYYDAIGSDCTNNQVSLNVDSNNLYIDGKTISQYIENLWEEVDKVKEKENNNMKFGNFDFGPVDSSVRMSLYGMAVKNSAGKYVAYDRATDSIMDVEILNFEGANKFMYKIPVAINAIEVGDVVVHNRLPMFVQEVLENNRLTVLDVYNGEEKVVVLSQSPFGFNFITKVVSLVDFAQSADKYNPFGNMLPCLIYLSLLCVIAGLGLLIYSEWTNDMHNSLFCFYVGIGLGCIAAILLIIATFAI